MNLWVLCEIGRPRPTPKPTRKVSAGFIPKQYSAPYKLIINLADCAKNAFGQVDRFYRWFATRENLNGYDHT